MTTPASFLSYAKYDDENSAGHLSQLRGALERELQGQLGDQTFRIFQDHEDLAWGQQWKQRIEQSIDGSLLLIPIISPYFFKREACRDELTRFLERESKLGRADLILPLYFISVPDFEATNKDVLVATVAQRQWRDWRAFRHEDLTSSEARKRIEKLAQEMYRTLTRTLTPKELELQRKRELSGRLKELHAEIGGPFRSGQVLPRVESQLHSAGIDSLERLLNHSERELREAGMTDQIIQTIIVDLAEFGQKLRAESEQLHPLDTLLLTPASRDAVRAAGIESVDELTAKTWNELMLTGHFFPNQIEEISLRLQTELGRTIREADERRLTYGEVLMNRASR